MKRFLLTTAFLTFIAIGVLWLYDSYDKFLIYSAPACGANKVRHVIEQKNPDEASIFGSSRANANFVPSLFPYPVFDYGFDGAGTSAVNLMLKKELEHREKRSPIIINIDPWGIHEGYGDYGNYVLYLSDPDVRKMIGPENIPWADLVPGFRFFGRFKSDLATYIQTYKSVTKRFDHGAILQLLTHSDEEWEVFIRKCQEWTFSTDITLDKELRELCTSTQRTIYLVVGPCAKPYAEKFKDEDALQNWCKSFAEVKNVRVINLFALSYSMPLTNFIDLTHLNFTGATFFTKELLRQIEVLEK